MRTMRVLLTVVMGAALAQSVRAEGHRRPSLLPEVARMAPFVDCFAAVQGDPGAKLTDCFTKAGIPFRNPPLDPETILDFKQLVALEWAVFGSSPSSPLRPELLDEAVSYARCVEAAAYADPDFKGRTTARVLNATFRAGQACKNEPIARHAHASLNGLSPASAVEWHFAERLADHALRYALMANGWFPDEMRPCIQYGDGRPPSPGCAGKPGFHPPPPPHM